MRWFPKYGIKKMSTMCPLLIMFICNTKIGSSNWLPCNTVAVSGCFKMNLFACETMSAFIAVLCESTLIVSNVPIWKKCARFYEDGFFSSSIWILIVSW